MIGHASKDERGKLKGGTAGDSTKKEVYTRTWYNRPWNVVIRFKDAKKAEKVAKAMEKACANNRIGYDQNQRNTVLTQARKFKYDMSKITTKCECDCSSLVSVCCMYAGVAENALYKGSNCATTSTLRSRLKGTGEVEVLTNNKYLTSDKYLKRGDILLYEGHHTAINLTDGEEVKTKNYLSKGDKGEDVGVMQTKLIYLGYSCGSKGADKHFGEATENAVECFQKAEGLEVDGKCGVKTQARLDERYNAKKNASKAVYLSCKGKYSGNSLTDALKAIGVNSSFTNRKKIASKNGIKGYEGTASQNEKMLNLLKQGKLIKA